MVAGYIQPAAYSPGAGWLRHTAGGPALLIAEARGANSILCFWPPLLATVAWLNRQGFLDSSFSVARYAESSQALVSYWRIPGRRLRNFAWLHVEPRPVPELAWGGELHAKLGFSRSMRLAKAKLKLGGLPGCGRIEQTAEAT